MISLSCRQSHKWFDYIGDKLRSWYSSSFNSTGFCYQNEKRKSPSPSAIQLKNWQKTISTRQKSDVISQFEKGGRIADICRMPLILAYEKLMKILTELQKVRCQELSVCVVQLQQSYQNKLCQKLWMLCLLLHFKCIMNNQTYCTEMYVYCIEMYMYCIYSRYTLHRSVCPLLVQIHTTKDEVVNPLTPEIHCFKWELCVWFEQFWFARCFSGT